VIVLPELRAAVTLKAAGSGLRAQVAAQGGSGRLLRASWILPSGRRAEGAAVRLPAGVRGTLTVEIADASGTVARTALSLRAGAAVIRSQTCEATRGERVDLPLPARLGLPRAGCRSRRHFTIRLRSPRGDRLVRATVRVNGKRVRTLTGRRLRARVDLRGLPSGRYSVEVVARTRSGRLLREMRRYRTCARRS
jgi:hypothetical protein